MAANCGQICVATGCLQFFWAPRRQALPSRIGGGAGGSSSSVGVGTLCADMWRYLPQHFSRADERMARTGYRGQRGVGAWRCGLFMSTEDGRQAHALLAHV